MEDGLAFWQEYSYVPREGQLCVYSTDEDLFMRINSACFNISIQWK
jgi:hypothetical protein